MAKKAAILLHSYHAAYYSCAITYAEIHLAVKLHTPNAPSRIRNCGSPFLSDIKYTLEAKQLRCSESSETSG